MRAQGMEVVLSGDTSLEEMQRVFSAKKKNRRLVNRSLEFAPERVRV